MERVELSAEGKKLTFNLIKLLSQLALLEFSDSPKKIYEGYIYDIEGLLKELKKYIIDPSSSIKEKGNKE